jgi:acyl-[acyl-carrier-protein]-phospholipid O-acyltransferase/long-chain-fatty-acid--[acyl-carrier-protein] ligase
VTSRAFLTKARIDLGMLETAGIRLVYLEDLRDRISGADKLKAKLSTMTGGGLGSRARNAWDGLSREERGSRTAVILFTSGSEGVPKGVQLSHRNILANVRQMLAVTDLTDADKLFNAMPLFHSFGLTVGCVLPLLSGMSVYLYPSPLHYRIIPSAVYECDATLMIATNTFLNGYARKAHPYDFRSVRCLFVAAEKLQEDTARIWAQRFGIRVLEGYGATECSPSVTLNTGPAPKFGSAGRLLPGMEMRMDPVDGVAEGGRLFVRGPNVMKGYLTDSPELLNDPQRWYDTGDVVRVDDEGFVFIQGRMKRFAKVGGEMISLTAVEDALAAAFVDFGPRCETAILIVQDRDRGEQLLAVTTDPRVTQESLRQAIRDHGLPNLAVPRYVRVIPEIPRLGTGKVNYRELERQISLPD